MTDRDQVSAAPFQRVISTQKSRLLLFLSFQRAVERALAQAFQKHCSIKTRKLNILSLLLVFFTHNRIKQPRPRLLSLQQQRSVAPASLSSSPRLLFTSRIKAARGATVFIPYRTLHRKNTLKNIPATRQSNQTLRLTASSFGKPTQRHTLAAALC